jgi:surface carbohydrate biosynthesis protein
MGRIILASYLAEKNYKVILFFKGHTDDVLRYCPRGIYFHFGIVTNYYKVIKKIKQLGHIVVAWDEEGFVFPSDDEYVNNRIDSKVYNELTKYFLWGDHQKNLLKKKVNDLSISATIGHPRFDLFRSEFREYLLNESKKIKQQFGKFILLNTKFNSNHFLGKNQAIDRLKEAQYFGNKNKFENFHKEKVKYNNSTFQYYLNLIPKLSKRFSNHNVIIRPHPSENFNTWKEIAIKNELRNVYVIHEGSVLQWLLAAEIMIHNGCTTGVESFILDKPSILYKPIIDNRFDIFLIDQLSKEINKEKVLLDTLNENLINKKTLFSNDDKKVKKSILRKYVCGIDGISSSENIYNELKKLNFKESKMNHNYFFHLRKKIFFKNAKEQFKKFILEGDEKKYLNHKFPNLTLKELNSTRDKLNESNNLYINTKIKKISSNIFCYYKK